MLTTTSGDATGKPKKGSPKGIGCLHTSAQNVRKKQGEIDSLVWKDKYDIVGIIKICNLVGQNS